MSDIRIRLANTLAAELEFRHGDCATWGAHIADVLLSLPGIAIVELPEPDKETPSYLNGSVAWDSETNVELAAWPSDGVITNAEGEEVGPGQCREYAAALLAAANAAEAAQ